MSRTEPTLKKPCQYALLFIGRRSRGAGLLVLVWLMCLFDPADLQAAEVPTVPVVVLCDEADARILVNGAFHGLVTATGKTVVRLPLGRHVIRLEKIGFEPEEKKIRIRGKRRYRVKFALEPKFVGILEVDMPRALGPVTVWVDGKVVGTIRFGEALFRIELALGKRQVRLSAPGLEDLVRQVRAGMGKVNRVSADLKKGGEALLMVTGAPPGARLFIDGQLVTRLPISAGVTVPAGTRRMRLERPGFEAREEWVLLVAKGKKSLSWELEPKFAGVLKLTVPEGLGFDSVSILVDGEGVGAVRAGDTQWFEVPLGKHRLRLESEHHEPREAVHHFKYGREFSWTADLRVKPRAKLRILQGTVGAKVWIDGQLLAESPPLERWLSPGLHTVEIRAEGHIPSKTRQAFKVGQVVEISAVLYGPEVEEVGAEGSWYTAWWAYASYGVLAGGALVGVYLLAADDGDGGLVPDAVFVPTGDGRVFPGNAP